MGFMGFSVHKLLWGSTVLDVNSLSWRLQFPYGFNTGSAGAENLRAEH